MMEFYFIWYISWGRTSRIYWSIHAARASIEIPVSSHLIYFLLEFIRFKFRIFAGDETILQQISALSARLDAKRATATWYEESLVRREANGTVASEMVNLFQQSGTTKGMKLRQTAAEWNDEEVKISNALELLELLIL